MAVLEVVQKHIRERDTMQWAGELSIALNQGLNTREQIEAVLNYILQVSDTVQPKALLQTLTHSTPQYEEVMMNIAQRLKDIARQEVQEEVRKEVRKEVLQEIREEVRMEGHKEVARAMLIRGIARDVVMQCTGLTEQDLQELNH